ncbi:MAG: hypothetical protein E7H17_00940 [Haemophilus parainfluenzae]|nr:hypothetical protein [Haemophilus parainfluenzae]DAY29013.1 MAG TPA: hypothetical protein [Bacteriophage sp.]
MLKISSEDAINIIDDTYKNYHLRKSGVLYDKDFETNGMTKDCYIPCVGFNSPIIVIHPRGHDYNSKVTYVPVSRNMTNKDYINSEYRNTFGFQIYVWWNLHVNEGIEYYIFDDWQPETAKYGLTLWNEKGEIIYHSDWYRLKLLGVHQLGRAGPSISNDLKIDISKFSNLSNKVGILMPFVRRCMMGGLPGQYLPPAGGHNTFNNYELGEGFFFKDKNTIQYSWVCLSGIDGWWFSWDQIITPPSSFILTVDLDGMPLNYN